MRIAPVPPSPSAATPPPWPPLLATRGPGSRSHPHAHHALHLLLCQAGALRARSGRGRWLTAAGVLTSPDVPHEIDATGAEVLLVFIDPESDVGEALRPALTDPLRLVGARERDVLIEGADPFALMRTSSLDWCHRVVATLGGQPLAKRHAMHPRVRRLLGHLRASPPDADTSLHALAAAVGLSPGRLMHAFTASVGLPLRPYVAWLRLQRAAAAIAAGMPLAHAATEAGFADAAHMSRSFRRMLGLSPSALRASLAAGS
jgi:AraC-like DNA-binding protein